MRKYSSQSGGQGRGYEYARRRAKDLPLKGASDIIEGIVPQVTPQLVVLEVAMLGTRAGWWIAKTRVSTFGGIHSKLIHFPGVNVKVSGCAGICNTEPHSPAQRKRVVTIKKKKTAFRFHEARRVLRMRATRSIK